MKKIPHKQSFFKPKLNTSATNTGETKGICEKKCLNTY